MANKTQIRLSALTGSAPSSSRSIQTSGIEYDSNNVGDFTDVLDHMASALVRIHGGSNWYDQDSGVFGDVKSKTHNSSDIGAGQSSANTVGYNFVGPTTLDTNYTRALRYSGSPPSFSSLANGDLLIIKVGSGATSEFTFRDPNGIYSYGYEAIIGSGFGYNLASTNEGNLTYSDSTSVDFGSSTTSITFSSMTNLL